jgi:hypothetical protein
MKIKESKAQLEVWEWKDSVSEEINKTPKGKRVSYITEKVKKLAAKLHIKTAKRQPVLR